MGGGSGSSSFSAKDVARLTEAAEQRLKQIARGTILIACHHSDRRSLESHIIRSSLADRIVPLDSTREEEARDQVASAAVVVVFTDQSRATAFLDTVVEIALAARRQGIHVRTSADALVPSKVTAYRWPSMSWERMEELFK